MYAYWLTIVYNSFDHWRDDSLAIGRDNAARVPMGPLPRALLVIQLCYNKTKGQPDSDQLFSVHLPVCHRTSDQRSYAILSDNIMYVKKTRGQAVIQVQKVEHTKSLIGLYNAGAINMSTDLSDCKQT